MRIFDFVARLRFLSVEDGCCTSVCASALPLEKLSGENDGYLVVLRKTDIVTTADT